MVTPLTTAKTPLKRMRQTGAKILEDSEPLTAVVPLFKRGRAEHTIHDERPEAQAAAFPSPKRIKVEQSPSNRSDTRVTAVTTLERGRAEPFNLNKDPESEVTLSPAPKRTSSSLSVDASLPTTTLSDTPRIPFQPPPCARNFMIPSDKHMSQWAPFIEQAKRGNLDCGLNLESHILVDPFFARLLISRLGPYMEIINTANLPYLEFALPYCMWNAERAKENDTRKDLSK